MRSVTAVKRKENIGTAALGLEPGKKKKRKNNKSLMHLSCVNSGSSTEVTVHLTGHKNKISMNLESGRLWLGKSDMANIYDFLRRVCLFGYCSNQSADFLWFIQSAHGND